MAKSEPWAAKVAAQILAEFISQVFVVSNLIMPWIFNLFIDSMLIKIINAICQTSLKHD